MTMNSIWSLVFRLLLAVGLARFADNVDPIADEVDLISEEEGSHEGHGSNGWGKD